VERGLASRGRGLHHGLGRLGNRSPGTTTRAARSWLHVLRRKWRGRKRGPEAENRQSGAPRGERPDRKGRGRLASARRAAQFGTPGVPRKHPHRLSALRSPSPGSMSKQMKQPGRKTRRGNESCCAQGGANDRRGDGRQCPPIVPAGHGSTLRPRPPGQHNGFADNDFPLPSRCPRGVHRSDG
jgi:hypothetical protein